jgi:hypothetical protein
MQLTRKPGRVASTRRRIAGFTLVAFFALAAVAFAAAKFHQVKSGTFDPAKTQLVNGGWVAGAGCPTDAATTSTGDKTPDGTYTDPACTTGDSKDKKNEGLLLVKTGPTGNVAAGGADLKDVKGITLTELGYDLRKGSHCGAGAPRFDIDTTDGFFFVGCSSPPPDSTTPGDGFDRLRWGVGGPLTGFNRDTNTFEPVTGTVNSIQIVFDEGTDQGTGEAIIDNVDVNGTLVGEGDHPKE